MKKVRAAPRGEGPQLFIADQIAEGAVAFLKTEYTYLLPFVVICAAFIVGILEGQSGSPVDYSDNKGGWQTTVCFLSGASLSALAGWMGMKIATETNVKTMQAAKESLNSALKIAFAGGAVMGFYVVALGILGLVCDYWFLDCLHEGRRRPIRIAPRVAQRRLLFLYPRHCLYDYLRRNFVQRFQVGLQVLRVCPHRSHRGYLSRRSHGILHVLRVHSG